MAKKEIKVTVKVRNLVAQGLESAKRQLMRFRRVSGATMKGVGVAAKGAAIAFGVLGLAIRKSFQFETYRTQFATLLGSMSAAKARFKELVEFSERTPFTPKGVVEASKILENMGLTGKDNIRVLQQVGDAAASMDPTKLQEIAMAFGRLNAQASQGTVGEPTMRLLELGIISADTKKRLEDLAKSTKNSGAVMAALAGDLGKFEGGMARLAETGGGLFSTFLGKIDIGLATFGDSLLELSKETLRDANKAIEDFTKSDKFKDWADKTGAALTVVKDIVSDLFGGDKGKQLSALDDIKSIFVGAMSAAVDVLIQGAAMAAQIIKAMVLSGGPSDADVQKAKIQAATEGHLGPATTKNGKTSASLTEEGKERAKQLAYKYHRERMIKEKGLKLDVPKSSVSDRFEKSYSDLKKSRNRSYMEDMMNGFSDFGIKPPDVPTAPAASAGGASLSVGDLYSRMYGGGGGKPDGTTARPMNIRIQDLSEKAKQHLFGGGMI